MRLQAEEPELAARPGAKLALARGYVDGVRGYDAALARVLALRAGARLPRRRRRSSDAVAATGGIPGGSPRSCGRAEPDQRADSAAARLRLRLATIEEPPGALADIDSEYLHDLRVAVRRTRSAQRQLRAVFPPEPLAVPRRVSVAAAPDRADARPRRPPLSSGTYRRAAADSAGRPRAAARAARGAPRRGSRDDGPRPAVPPHERCCRLAGVPRRAGRGASRRPAGRRATGRRGRGRADPQGLPAHGEGRPRDRRRSPPEALHDLRKSGKELRYLLEFFAALYPPEVVKPMVGRSRRCRTRSAASTTARCRRTRCARSARRSPPPRMARRR